MSNDAQDSGSRLKISDTLSRTARHFHIDLESIADSAIRERLLREPTLAMTSRMQRALLSAYAEAKQHGHSYLGTEHVFLAILLDPAAIPSQILQEIGVADGVVQRLRKWIDAEEQHVSNEGEDSG